MKDKRINKYMSMAAVFAVCSTMLSYGVLSSEKKQKNLTQTQRMEIGKFGSNNMLKTITCKTDTEI